MRTLIAIAVLAAASPALADTELSIGGASRSLRTPSANAITGDNLPSFELSAARDLTEDLDLEILPRLSLWAVAGYRTGGVEGSTFGMDTEASTHVITLGGRARYQLNRFVVAHVRGELGSQRTALDIGGMSDSAWGPVAVGAAGVDLQVPIGGTGLLGAIGIRFEYGYVAASGLELFPTEMRDEANLSLQTSQASIGRLDLQGRFWALSLFTQF